VIDSLWGTLYIAPMARQHQSYREKLKRHSIDWSKMPRTTPGSVGAQNERQQLRDIEEGEGWLSNAPGVGSAAGGLIGSMVAPGVGTAIGAGIGGLAGLATQGIGGLLMSGDKRKAEAAVAAASEKERIRLEREAERRARFQAVTQLMGSMR